jgi:hypothetical protein
MAREPPLHPIQPAVLPRSHRHDPRLGVQNGACTGAAQRGKPPGWGRDRTLHLRQVGYRNWNRAFFAEVDCRWITGFERNSVSFEIRDISGRDQRRIDIVRPGEGNLLLPGTGPAESSDHQVELATVEAGQQPGFRPLSPGDTRLQIGGHTLYQLNFHSAGDGSRIVDPRWVPDKSNSKISSLHSVERVVRVPGNVAGAKNQPQEHRRHSFIHESHGGYAVVGEPAGLLILSAHGVAWGDSHHHQRCS